MRQHDDSHDPSAPDSARNSRNPTETNCPETDGERLPQVADDDLPVPVEFDADRLVRDAIGVARGEISDRAFARKYGNADPEGEEPNSGSPE